jgi:small subunit ribosomal protein S7
MSRRKAAVVKNIIPDAKFGSVLVAKFINYLMMDGKKSIAESAVYESLEDLSQKLNMNPVEALEASLANIRPLVEVRSRRVGGATYQVPCDVRPRRAIKLAMKWLIAASRSRKDKRTIAKKLAAELLDAYSKRGEAFKKCENTHKMAEANKPFAHYNW